MKIRMTRSDIVIEIDKRKIKISGELAIDPPVFYADILGIKNWEPPHENELITEDDIRHLISRVEKEHNVKEGAVKILFD